MSTPCDRYDATHSVTVPRPTRRKALAMLAAAPVALIALPSVVGAVGVDPVALATHELVEASHEVERVLDATGDVGAGILGWVRTTVRLHEELAAEHGEDAGGAIWRAAMDRHYAWLGRRYGPDAA